MLLALRISGIYALLACAGLAFAADGPEQRVIVVGEVRSMTEVPYTAGLKLSDAIIAAGGFSGSSHTPVYLVRRGQITKFDIHVIIEVGHGAPNNPLVEPWDLIVVGDTVRKRP